jgi:hypothetical protein
VFDVVEATSAQQKAMNDAKMKKMEDDKVKEKKKIKEDMKGMSQKSGDKRSTESGAGMTAKGVAKYNRRTGGDLKTAVTTPPSKLKAGSKAAGRRKSFCARSKSWDGPRGKAARRRWNCEFDRAQNDFLLPAALDPAFSFDGGVVTAVFKSPPVRLLYLATPFAVIPAPLSVLLLSPDF